MNQKEILPDGDANSEKSEPRDQVVTRLSAIWAELLGVAHVSSDDNLLLLGGESLIATQITSRIRDRFDVDISIRSVLVNTVGEVADEITALAKLK